jgi:hypothetical protein
MAHMIARDPLYEGIPRTCHRHQDLDLYNEVESRVFSGSAGDVYHLKTAAACRHINARGTGRRPCSVVPVHCVRCSQASP